MIAPTQNAPVDVLAVLDRAIKRARDCAAAPHHVPAGEDGMLAARAAVTELIEAVDDALTPGGGAARMVAVHARVVAALARCKGGAR